MWVHADVEQIAGLVKERNRYYHALLEIEAIAQNASSSDDFETCRSKLRAILEECVSARKRLRVSKRLIEFIEQRMSSKQGGN